MKAKGCLLVLLVVELQVEIVGENLSLLRLRGSRLERTKVERKSREKVERTELYMKTKKDRRPNEKR